MKRRLLATFLSLCLLVGLLPTVALAEESPASETQGESSEQQATATDSTHVSTTDILSGNSTDGTMSGTCGATEQDNVRWTLNKNGETVTIDGEPKDAYTLTISGTGAMADISYNWTNVDTAPWAQFRSQITRIVIDKGITSIGKYAFIKTSIRDLDLSVCSSLTCISERAFSNIGTDFVSVTFPESLEEIGEAAFSGAGFTEVDLTKCKILRTLGDEAFGHCSNLKSVNILECESLREIGKSCFYSCKKLEDIKLPNSITSIKDAAFADTGLTKVNWNNLTNLESIAGQVFSINNNLSVVSLSGCSSLETIGRYLFLGSINVITVDLTGCTSLTQLEYPHEFDDVAQNCVVYSEIPLKLPSKTIGAITDGGTFAEDTTFTAGTLATPTKDGAIFEGWYDNEQCSGTVVDSPTAGQTYYAKWTQSNYNISDSALDFGSVSYGSAVGAQTITVSSNSESGSGSLTAESSNDAIFSVDVIDSTVSVKPAENLGVGTYNEVITITTPDDATFFVDVSITIEQAPTSIGITAKPTSLTGGGTVTLTVNKSGLPQNAAVSVSGYSGILDTGNGTYTVTLPNATADYTFTVQYQGDINHLPAGAECTVSVTQYTPPVMDNPPSSGSGYLVSLDGATDGGTVTVRPVRADQGELVTITVTPDPGYVLDSLTVQKANGTAVPLTKVSDSVYTFQMPDSRVTVSATFKAAPVHSFTDVKPADYYYDAVLWAAANGVTNGITATTFGPELAVSRAQMVTFLWRASGSPKATGTNPFADVSTSDYYYDAVLWAVANGVTKGTSSTTFSPDAVVTRAQAVTFLWRAAGAPAAAGSSFADVPADAYFANAVAWAVANGITNGTSSTTFSPDAVVTRAQAVAFLYRAAQ